MFALKINETISTQAAFFSLVDISRFFFLIAWEPWLANEMQTN